MIAIELNGEPREVEPGQHVQGLMAVAVNREIVPRHLWPQRELQPSDRVDIVRAIGGG